jgi:hypothetical protein
MSVLGKRKHNDNSISRGNWNWLGNYDGSCYSIAVIEVVVRIDEILNYPIENNYYRKFLHSVRKDLSTYPKFFIPEEIDARKHTNSLYRYIKKFKPDGGEIYNFWKCLKDNLDLKLSLDLYSNEWNKRIPHEIKTPNIFTFTYFKKKVIMRDTVVIYRKKETSVQKRLNKYFKKRFLINFPKILVVELYLPENLWKLPSYELPKIKVDEKITLKKNEINVDRLEYEKMLTKKENFKRIPWIKDNCSNEQTYSLVGVVKSDFLDDDYHATSYVRERLSSDNSRYLWKFIDNGGENHSLSYFSNKYTDHSANLLFYVRN